MTEPRPLWGDRTRWNVNDPRRGCYTCGQAPIGTFNDGSPRYPASCDHEPAGPRRPAVTVR
jgi:hypothetical protein